MTNPIRLPRFVFSVCAGLFVGMHLLSAEAAQSVEDVKKARMQCSRLAEKLGNARKLPNNTVQASGNYNVDKEICYAQIEISQIMKKSEESEAEKRHRQIFLMDATTTEILALVMWEEPTGLRVGHIYDPKYDGPRDDYEKVDLYIRKKMALNLR